MKKSLALSLSFLLGSGASLSATPLLSIGDHADLYATLDGSVAYTDNLTLDENDELDDFRFIVRPGAVFQLGRGLTNLDANLTASYGIIRYVDNTVFDTELWNVGANANFRGPRYNVGLGAGYRERQQNENDINANRTLVTQEIAFVEGDLRYRLSQKFSFGLGGEFEDRSYDGGRNIDRNIITVPVDLFYELTPKLDASGGVRYRQTDLDQGVDSDDVFYNLGLNGSLTEKFSTRLKAGYQTRDFTGDRESEGTLSVISTSNYDLSTRTTLRLILDRDFATAGEGSSVERTNVRLTAFYLFSPRLNGDLSGAYTLSDYEGSSREDDTYRIRAGLNYRFNELLSLNASYTFRDNDSNFRGSSYTENMVELGANFRY